MEFCPTFCKNIIQGEAWQTKSEQGQVNLQDDKH
jgi:hypothetical protein